jgi:hypothetical protein
MLRLAMPDMHGLYMLSIKTAVGAVEAKSRIFYRSLRQALAYLPDISLKKMDVSVTASLE